MSERETGERIVQVPLQFIKPLPFNTTVISAEEEHMIREEMKKPDGPDRIDPILLRRLTPEEIEECRDKNPWVKYEIIDGHTRFHIANELHWPWIRARILDISREDAYEMNYRKNKERGHVSLLAEAIYFKHLQADLKMSPRDIAERFGYTENQVKDILSRAVLPRDARGYITSKLPEVGKLLSSKHLKIIASAPQEKQRAVAEAVIEGRLRPKEAEVAKEAIVQGLPKDEAIKVAKGRAAASFEATSAPSAPASTITTAEAPSVAEALEGEIVCPKCGLKAHVNWASREVEWLQS